MSHIDDDTRDPASDERVRAVLDALAAPTEPGPQPGEVDALAAFRAQHRTRSSSVKHLTPFRVAVASAVSAGVFLTGGVAAAATGSLPGAAQDVAHEMIAALGIEVPAGERAADDADERGSADEDSTTETDPDATGTEDAEADAEPADPEANDHGQEVREVAQDDSLTGRDKGVAVSGTASEGRSRAGGQGGAPEDGSDGAGSADSARGGGSAPVEAPNGGGTGTADGASTANDGGASTNGTGTADEASGGRSTSGSGNSGTP